MSQFKLNHLMTTSLTDEHFAVAIYWGLEKTSSNESFRFRFKSIKGFPEQTIILWFDVRCELIAIQTTTCTMTSQKQSATMTKLYSFLNIIYCVTSSLTSTSLTWRQADILTHKDIKHNSMLAKSEALGVSSILFYVNNFSDKNDPI